MKYEHQALWILFTINSFTDSINEIITLGSHNPKIKIEHIMDPKANKYIGGGSE